LKSRSQFALAADRVLRHVPIHSPLYLTHSNAIIPHMLERQRDSDPRDSRSSARPQGLITSRTHVGIHPGAKPQHQQS
jgi:hypothetical protein